MRFRTITLAITGAVTSLGWHLPLMAQGGIVDLTRLSNYANQPIPDYILKDNTGNGGNANPITDIGATLGRVLFYDKRLSRNDTISCASCHQQEHAFGDPDTASTGVSGTTGRHSMRLINARFSRESKFFWDERAATLEAQSTQPIHDHIEMGFSDRDGDPSFTDLVTKLSLIEEYKVLFTAVYGGPGIDEDRIQKALAQFVRSIQSFDSKYDIGRSVIGNDDDPFTNFTDEENSGKALFLRAPGDGGADCASCHQPPEFDIAPFSGNNGIISAIGGGNDFTVTRSPSLRDTVDTSGIPHGGFMHDASLPTLSDVINHYNSIPTNNEGLDARLARIGRSGDQGQQLNLTQTEKDNLVAFLKTLTGNAVYVDPKWSNPFDANNSLQVIVLPMDTDHLIFTGSGTSREVTVNAQAVPLIDYVFQTSSDLVNWTSTNITAPVSGALTMTVAAPEGTGKQFYRYIYIPES
ncbi:MAG: cytochrome-c peroxidase [Verrucomicrobiae bacterium]|nr:cytochrome-c peroxidase [Verrucomicrobiae bacterium]NNJ41724.1 cytochrome-c peroxidase [Akkermansiaceae bacterium]